MDAAGLGLLAVGYPAAAAVLTRFTAVVRAQRWRWLAVHHVGMTAIVVGWALRGRPSAALVNGAWLVASSAWFAVGGRKAPPRSATAEAQSALPAE